MLRNFLLTSLSNTLSKALIFLITPVVMTVLSPADLGLWALINSSITILSVFLGLGLRQYIHLEYFHLQPEQRRPFITQIIGLYLTLAPIILASIFVFLFFWFEAVQKNTLLIFAVVLYAFFVFFLELLYQLLRYSKNIRTLVGIQLTSAGIYTISTLFLVMYCNWGVTGMVSSMFCSISLPMIAGLYLYTQKGWSETIALASLPSYSKTLCKSLPFIPGLLSSWLLSSSSRWILAYFGTLADVGIFAIADIVTQLFDIVLIQPLNGTYVPQLLESYVKGNAQELEKQHKKRILVAVVIVLLLLTLGYLLCAPLLKPFLPMQYHACLFSAYILACGATFLAASHAACAYPQFLKRRTFLAIAWVLPAIINIGISIFLTKHFSIMGTVIAQAVAYALFFLIIYFL